LDRIGERQLDLDGTYTYDSDSASSVTAYIVDTGIFTTHVDFGGRAVWGDNFVDTQDTDCNGHGTHVAGTVGGTSYGVAKKTTLIAVKVLNCGGSGSNAGVISGVTYVGNDHKSKNNKAVANMSLGGGLSTALNAAVAAAVQTGVTFVVAAGNSDDDACYYSPASEKTAISVAATDVGEEGVTNVDIRSSYSNYGTCTDVFAPGTAITSAWIGTTTATRTISGTSMASPHVCGVAAIILDQNPSYTPAQVGAAIVSTATQNEIDLQCSDSACLQSPNLLVYKTC